MKKKLENHYHEMWDFYFGQKLSVDETNNRGMKPPEPTDQE